MEISSQHPQDRALHSQACQRPSHDRHVRSIVSGRKAAKPHALFQERFVQKEPSGTLILSLICSLRVLRMLSLRVEASELRGRALASSIVNSRPHGSEATTSKIKGSV